MKMLDTLRSLVSGLGTAKDKTTSLEYGLRLLSDAELNAMHRSDWLARKIVDIIPNDMTREWRDWSATAEQIQAIEEVEKSPVINLQPKVNLALQKARLFGGSAIYMGMKDKTPWLPLDVERVQKGDLLYLHVLTRREITAGEISYDVTSEFYGQPAWYELNGSIGSMIKVHPSRIVRFIGAEILDTRFSVDLLNAGWGDSVLQIVYDAVTNASSVQAHVASMIPEAKTDVMYIPGLSDILRSPATTKLLTDRFTYANTMKSMFNMILLEGDGKDAGEKWEQKQIHFATLPEIVAQFLQIAAGAADIPVTRLVGEAPKGFQATGESNIRDYYDNVSARQKTELAPALHRLDEVIIRSALGARDPAIYYEWAPLWSMSEKEKADIFNTKATAARSLVGTGGASPQIIPIDALSEALVNAFVEDGSLPGLDAAIEEFGSLAEQEPIEPTVAEAAVVPPKTPVAA